MKFLVRMGPRETKTITIGTKIQLEHLLINLCNNMPYFARESNLGCILEISDEALKELYKSLPDDCAELFTTNQSQVIATFIQKFFGIYGLNKYAEVRFVSPLPKENTGNEFSDFLCSSD